MSAYARLLTTDFEEPSEILNDIDEAREDLQHNPKTSLDEAFRVESKCRDLEMQLHLKFTPPLMRYDHLT